MGRVGRIKWRLPKADWSPGGHFVRPASDGRLEEVVGFGANAGNLRMLKHVPASRASMPLVVVLHGCTQTAGGYDSGAGWSSLADEYGFALLFPEQKRENNPKTCFTWFEPGDTRRGAGEASSIREMVARMCADHDIDATRVFVTGLSAGGAMTSVMLATYPDVFAAGAIIAGLPYGAAGNVQEAFHSMYQGPSRPAEDWGALVRTASPHRGPWPRVSVWHGSADKTVVPGNAEEIVKQWTDVHETGTIPDQRTGVGYTKRVWRNEEGIEVVESVLVAGLTHGTPLAVGDEAEVCGQAGPYLLDAGISSTHHIARFFGVLEAAEITLPDIALTSPARLENKRSTPDMNSPEERRTRSQDFGRRTPILTDVHAVITDALRSAGLMK